MSLLSRIILAVVAVVVGWSTIVVGAAFAATGPLTKIIKAKLEAQLLAKVELEGIRPSIPLAIKVERLGVRRGAVEVVSVRGAVIRISPGALLEGRVAPGLISTEELLVNIDHMSELGGAPDIPPAPTPPPEATDETAKAEAVKEALPFEELRVHADRVLLASLSQVGFEPTVLSPVDIRATRPADSATTGIALRVEADLGFEGQPLRADLAWNPIEARTSILLLGDRVKGTSQFVRKIPRYGFFLERDYGIEAEFDLRARIVMARGEVDELEIDFDILDGKLVRPWALPITIEGIRTNIEIDEERLVVSNLEGKLGGAFIGHFAYRFGDAEHDFPSSFSVLAGFRDVRLERLLEMNGKNDLGASGVLFGRMAVYSDSRGAPFGEVEIGSTRARLWDLPVFVELLRVLKLEAPTDSYMDELYLWGSIRPGGFVIRTVQVASDVVSVVGEGTMTVDGALDLRVWPSVFLESTVKPSKISEDEKAIDRAFAEVRISGTVSKPVVEVVPATPIIDPIRRFLRSIRDAMLGG